MWALGCIPALVFLAWNSSLCLKNRMIWFSLRKPWLNPRLSPFFDHMSSGEFRQAVEKISGYHTSADFGLVDFIS